MKKKDDLQLGKFCRQLREVRQIAESLRYRKAVKGRQSGMEKHIEYTSESRAFPAFGAPRYATMASVRVRNSVESNNKKMATKANAQIALEAYLLWAAGKIAWKYGIVLVSDKEET